MRDTHISADALLGWLNASQGAEELVKQCAIALCEEYGYDPMAVLNDQGGEEHPILYQWESFTDDARTILDLLLCGEVGKRILEIQILWSNFREAERNATDRVNSSTDGV